MSKLKFGSKRDSNGLLLHNSAYKLSHKVVDDCMDVIDKYEVYKWLIRCYDAKYVEFYFRKTFFYAFLPIANQLVIHRWNRKNCNSNKGVGIDVSNFPSFELLKLVWPTNYEAEYYRTIKGRFLSKLHKVKKRYKKVTQLYVDAMYGDRVRFKSKSILIHGNKKIAVKNCEGIDLKKRSSIFWLESNQVDRSDILIYFDSEHSKCTSLIKSLEMLHVNWVNIRGWQYKSKSLKYTSELRYLKRIHSFDAVHNWLREESILLMHNIDYWYSFFLEFNIKVHSDNQEHGLDVVEKQIALSRLNSVSFSYQRSYLDNLVGRFFCYYPTDIFFAWGQDAAIRLINKVERNDHPEINSIIITGCYHLNKSILEESNSIKLIKQKFENSGVKKVILFLDTNHTPCCDWTGQSITTDEMEKLYISLLTLLMENKHIGIIVKPKKTIYINSLYNIYNTMQKALDTERLHIVDEPEGKKPSEYANISDIVVSIASHDIPSSLVECVISKKPGLIYDYAGLHSVEKKFYSWAQDTVMFSNIGGMIECLSEFVMNDEYVGEIGNWLDHIYEFDSFCDLEATNRIGSYIAILLQGLSSDLDKQTVIDRANVIYRAQHGKDKILFID